MAKGKNARKRMARSFAEEAEFEATEFLRPTPKMCRYRTAHIDPGKSLADQGAHIAYSTTADALGTVKDNVGCTVTSLDYRRYR